MLKAVIEGPLGASLPSVGVVGPGASSANQTAPHVERQSNSTHCDHLDQIPEQLYITMSHSWYCCLALITSIGLLISFVSNMIIIYLFTSTPSLRKNPSHIIAVNLSLSDLLYCTQWPSVIYCSLTQTTWILEHSFVCKSFGFITVITAQASVLTILVMSFERAFVIINSMSAKHCFSSRVAWLVIIVIWLISLIGGLPPLFGKYNRYTLDPSKTSCTLDYLSRQTDYKLYILVLYVAYWIAPTILISTSYALIFAAFKRSSISLRQVSIVSDIQPPSSLSSSSKSARSFPAPHQINFGRKRSSHLASCLTSMQAASMKFLYRPTSSYADNCRPDAPTNAIGFRTINRADYRSLPTQCVNTSPTTGEIELSDITLHFEFGPRASGCAESEPDRLPDGDSQPQRLCNNSLIDTPNDPDRYQRQLKACRIQESEDPNDERPAKMRSSSVSSLGNSRIHRNSNNPHLPLQASFSSNSTQARARLHYRLAKMSLYLILLWLISWTPIASLAMIHLMVECHKVSATAVFIANTMTKLGPAFDVFIYGISHPKIKLRFKEIIKRLTMIDLIQRPY